MISVVIPTYNDAHYLPTALKSCLNQTIPLEIVLVDDCSAAPLPADVCRFIDQHRDIVTLVRHGSNCGLSAARNTGIAHARFELIVPLDADDWFLPGALAPLVSAMTEDVDIAYGDVFDSGKLYEPVKRPLRRTDFLEDNPLFCSSLFRKRVWQAVGGYTVRPGPHYEDWNFWAKAFKAGFRFKYAPLTVYEHRSRPDSMLRHLHDERARFVTIATEPLQEPETDGRAHGLPGDAAPAHAEAPPVDATAPRPADVIDPSLRTKAVDLLRAHARIGQLMIELERVQRMAAAQAAQRMSQLVQAHATIGRLLLEKNSTRPELVVPRDERPHLGRGNNAAS